jgi:uncharacterized protein YutE (UPF0331/DUF86 family)
VTGVTCAFWEPIGGYERDATSRKWIFAHRLIQEMASIEFYGKQLINLVTAKSNDKLVLAKVIDKLKMLQIINSEDQFILKKMCSTRNQLAHNPLEYVNIEEKTLFEQSENAQRISDNLIDKLMKHSKDRI